MPINHIAKSRCSVQYIIICFSRCITYSTIAQTNPKKRSVSNGLYIWDLNAAGAQYAKPQTTTIQLDYYFFDLVSVKCVFATGTVGGCVKWKAAISQGKYIPKGTFVKGTQ